MSMPITPLDRESNRQKVEPERDSISKEMPSNLHIWKKVLYWILVKPGWCRKSAYMNPLGSWYTCIFLPSDFSGY